MTYEAIFRALGWTLVHSLWQAAAIAFLLWLTLPRLRRAPQRYWVSYAALWLIFLVAGITYWRCYEPVGLVHDTDAGGMIIWLQGSSAFSPAPLNRFWIDFSAWLDTNHYLLVGAWVAGLLFFLFRLGGGLWQIHRLRRQAVWPAEPYWVDRMSAIGRQMGLRRPVLLLESALAQTPMALGWLKPVVLMPLGLINQMTPAEVEAVLAHELAHIARRDWVFNLLQAFIESLFYYHPAVWWISAVVRRERENCCDDAALLATGNPIAFAKALVQVQEKAIPVPALALGLGGKRRKPLLERVRRILNQPPQQQHQAMEKITATVILLALLLLIGLRANSVPSVQAAFSQISELPDYFFGNHDQVVNDTLPKPKSTRKIVREDDNEKVEAEYQDGKLTKLKINDAEIPPADFDQHEDVLESLESLEVPEPPMPPFPPYHFDFPAPPAPPGAPVRVFSDQDGDGNTVIVVDKDGSATEIVVKNKEVYVNGKKLEKGESLDIPGIHFGTDDGYYFFDTVEGASIQLEMERAHREMERAMRETERYMKEGRAAQERELKRAHREMERAQVELEKEQKRWEKEQKKWEKEHRAWEAKHKAMEERLKSELVKDGLINNPDNFSLKINDKEMKVNKKVQSEAMRQKYIKIMEEMTGQKLNGKGSFYYNFTDDDDE